MNNKESAKDILLDNGYEDIKYLTTYSYDSALVGVSNDNRAIYDYEKMIEWLMEVEGFSEEDARDWIDFNTIRALGYMEPNSPIVMFGLIK